MREQVRGSSFVVRGSSSSRVTRRSPFGQQLREVPHLDRAALSMKPSADVHQAAHVGGDDGVGAALFDVGDLTVEQADPGTGVIANAVAVPATPVGIAAGDKALYVAGSNASVARVDPTTGCVTAWMIVGGLGTDPIAVAATSMAVYVGYDSGAIAVLDPTTLAVRHAYRLDTQDDQGGLAFAGGSVWYPTFGSNTILRVNP